MKYQYLPLITIIRKDTRCGVKPCSLAHALRRFGENRLNPYMWGGTDTSDVSLNFHNTVRFIHFYPGEKLCLKKTFTKSCSFASTTVSSTLLVQQKILDTACQSSRKSPYSYAEFSMSGVVMVIIHEIRPNLFLKHVRTARVRWLTSTVRKHGSINIVAPFVTSLPHIAIQLHWRHNRHHK